MKKNRETHAELAVAGALLLPAVYVCLEIGGVFDPPGTPDNAFAHAFPGVLVVSAPAVLILWVLYQRLGRVLSARPAIRFVFRFAIRVAWPLPTLGFVFGFYAAPYSEVPFVFLGMVLVFAVIWSSLVLGGLVQWSQLRPNKSFKPNSLRESA